MPKKIHPIIIVLLITFLAFIPALNNGITNWDDDLHITNNRLIRSLDFASIKNMFQATILDTYIPLTLVSFAIDFQIGKMNPFWYHLHNVLLHVLVTGLIFFFAIQIGISRRAALIGALLFGVHPMHVESVAWITERKDVLYATFYMLSVISYWQYLKTKKWAPYIVAIICGLLSILAKAMALSLPLVLWACDYLYQRKWDKKLLFDKIPFFLYIIPIAWITYSLNARVPMQQGIFEGLLIWVWTFIFYPFKFFVPLTFIPLYQHPEPITLTNPAYLFSLGTFLLLWISLFRFRSNKYYVFAVLVYVLSMFFLFRMDTVMDESIVADRFMYLPSFGICLFLGYLIDKKLTGLFALKLKMAYIGAICVFTLLFTKTLMQCGIWENNIILWEYVLKHSPRKASAYGNRGDAYRKMQKYDLALEDFNKALKMNPNLVNVRNSRGYVYFLRKNYHAALMDLQKVIELNPGHMHAHHNLGNVYRELAMYDLALKHLNHSINIDANYLGNYIVRGLTYGHLKKTDLALKDFNQALKLNPFSEEAYNNRGTIYLGQNKIDSALKDFGQAVRINGEFKDAISNRGYAYMLKGDFINAMKDIKRVLELDPNFATAYFNRGRIYVVSQELDLALNDFNKSIELDQENASYYLERAKVFIKTEDLTSALLDFNQSIAVDPKNKDAYKDRGFVYTKLKDYNSALSDYEMYLQFDPKNDKVFVERGKIYYGLQNYVEAIGELSKAIAANQNNGLAFHLRSWSQFKLNNIKPAYEDILKAKKLGEAIDESYVNGLVKYLEGEH